ncbi:MAG: hypothetical protein ACFB0C_18535 [Leptolyngbyaceae cyanobacterium]
MQYLAKVEPVEPDTPPTLRLLARHIKDYMWERLEDERVVTLREAGSWSNGALVLVNLDDNDEQGIAAEDATPWVMDLVDTFLAQGVTPRTLEQEVERAEQWRQSLTLESQEVDRRALEATARRDEIQELEKSLKLERIDLERREAELQDRLNGLDAS